MIEVRRITAADRPALENLLWQYYETSLFILGNLEKTGLSDQGKPYQGTYIGGFIDGRLAGVIVRYWNGNCMPQGEVEAVKAIWDRIDLFPVPINGFVGRNDLCILLRDALLQMKGLKASVMDLNQREILYKLPLQNLNVPEPRGDQQLQLVPATEAHMSFLLPWMIDYNVEALNAVHDQSLAEHCHDSLLMRIAADNCFILYDRTVPVATTGFNSRVKPFIQIGGVWTPPDYRRNGYAQTAIARSLQWAMAEGFEHSVLFTDEHNLPARTAYERLGYQSAGYFGLYLLKA